MTRVAAAKKRRQFDPETFLSITNGVGGRKILAFPKKQTIFPQRASFFMNRFGTLGFVEYKGRVDCKLTVHF